MVDYKILKLLSHLLEVSVLHIHAALESCEQFNGCPQDLMHRLRKAPGYIQEHTYAMGWIHMLVLLASNVMPAIIAEAFIMARMLLI